MNVDPYIMDFLKRNSVAVLATANKVDATPHAAAVFYEPDTHANLFFLTKKDTAKTKNLEDNPQADMVIIEPQSLLTAQISGKVRQMTDPVMLGKALRIMSRHSMEIAGTPETPISKLNAGNSILYMLRPESIRLGDYKYGARDFIFDTATPAEQSLE